MRHVRESRSCSVCTMVALDSCEFAPTKYLFRYFCTVLNIVVSCIRIIDCHVDMAMYKPEILHFADLCVSFHPVIISCIGMFQLVRGGRCYIMAVFSVLGRFCFGYGHTIAVLKPLILSMVREKVVVISLW